MNKNMVETLVGAVVLLVTLGFGVFAYQSSNLKPVDGYALTARFSNVDGVGTGSEVRIGGIKVGVISDMTLDDATYEALLTLQLRDGVKLPEDSTAAIVSAGLLGSKYVDIQPGAMDDMLQEGDEISFTQSSVNFESLLGKMVHSGGGVEGEADAGGDDELMEDTPAASAKSETMAPTLDF